MKKRQIYKTVLLILLGLVVIGICAVSAQATTVYQTVSRADKSKIEGVYGDMYGFDSIFLINDSIITHDLGPDRFIYYVARMDAIAQKAEGKGRFYITVDENNQIVYIVVQEQDNNQFTISLDFRRATRKYKPKSVQMQYHAHID